MATHDTKKPQATMTKVASHVAQRAPEQDVAAPEAERTAPVVPSRLAGPPSPQQARAMQRMQRTVGNAQVQRMLSTAAAQPQTYAKPQIQTPATATAQRSGETTAPMVEVQRTPAPSTIPAMPIQRATAPISRNLLGSVGKGLVNLGKAVVNGVGDVGKLAFEKALSMAGVDPKRVMGFIRAGGAVKLIIENPVRFANTLIKGVRQGFTGFQGNIARHVQSSFSDLLFGAMSGAGVSIPKDFSPTSILTLVLQVLNITPPALKQRVAKQVGEKNVERMEQAWGAISAVMKNGPGGLWTMLKEDLGDLKAMVIDEIKNWVITSLIKGAVIKILSMFNPASSIAVAIKTIYNVVTFLMQRARQIGALLGAVVGSVGAMARGDTSGVATRIEQVLSKALSVAIGFFAAMAGVGNIAGKVRKTIAGVRSRVQSAIDKMIAKVVNKFKGVVGKFGGKPGTGAGTSQANPTNDQQRLRQGVMAGVAAVNKLSGKQVDAAAINPLLAPIKSSHKLGVLEPVVQGEYWAVHGEIRRMTEKTAVLASSSYKQRKTYIVYVLKELKPEGLVRYVGRASGIGTPEQVFQQRRKKDKGGEHHIIRKYGHFNHEFIDVDDAKNYGTKPIDEQEEAKRKFANEGSEGVWHDYYRDEYDRKGHPPLLNGHSPLSDKPKKKSKFERNRAKVTAYAELFRSYFKQ